MPLQRPLKSEMLRRMRTAPAVRALLCVAAVLALGASFGLHPEPGEGLSAASATFAKSVGPQATHGCVACLSHGVALTAPLVGIVLAGSPREPAIPPADPLRHGRLAGTELPGRSPPLDRS